MTGKSEREKDRVFVRNSEMGRDQGQNSTGREEVGGEVVGERMGWGQSLGVKFCRGARNFRRGGDSILFGHWDRCGGSLGRC